MKSACLKVWFYFDTSIHGKGNVTTYEYNAANKVTKRIDPGGRTGTSRNYTYTDSKVEKYTYYADGNLETRTDRKGNKTSYKYDSHGRVLEQTTATDTITYTYDNNGNQLTMTDTTGTTTRTYDELNRVLTKTVPSIGTTTFVYDKISNIEPGRSIETSKDPRGNLTEKVYDKVGRLIEVIADAKTTTYSYYENGARKAVEYSDGAREDYTYYKDGLLWTLTNKKADGTKLDSYSYIYDEAHNQTSKIDAKGKTSYTYDELNRLETVKEPNTVTTSYTYDKAGNRVTEEILLGAVKTTNTYSYNEQNRLDKVVTDQNGTITTTTEYDYDSNGNQLTTKVNGVVTLINIYDNLNQLIKSVAGQTTIENAYNGEGYRVEKKVNGVIKRYLYEYDKVVLELDASGIQTGRNVYGTNLLMRTSEGTSYYYMYNGHADVTALLKPDGAVAATYYYDAFGNITDTTGTTSNTITYAGYQYDKETGLYYLNARMYDPKTARFLQEDTYRGDRNDSLSLNLYTYCHNEPLMYYDPTGHNAVTDWFSNQVKKTKAGWNSLTGGNFKEDINTIATYSDSKFARDTATGFQSLVLSTPEDFKEDINTIATYSDSKFARDTATGFQSLVLSTPEERQKDLDIIGKYGGDSSYVKRVTNAGKNIGNISDFIKGKVKNAKNNLTNWKKGITDAFSSKEGFKNASLGVGSSVLNGGLNTAKIILTSMSFDPKNTWNQLGSSIDWTNENIQTNLVTNQNTFQTFSTFGDAGQMAWGVGGLYNTFKGGIRFPGFNNSSAFMDAGTGMSISGIPDDFGKINVSPINGVNRGTAGASEVAEDVSKFGKYDVGIYNEIKGVSGLDAHHVGQKALMKDFIPDYNPETAPSILVPKVGHTLRGPNGIVSRSTSGITNARDLIARDIMELRRVYPDIPNTQLQKLIDMNKEMYPTIKKGR